jgi:hypothetical protein
MPSDIFIRVASFCAIFLLFLSQFVPTAYIEIKSVLLFFGFFSVLLSMLKGNLFLLRWQLLAILIFIISSVLYSIYGMIRGNPGAIRVLSIWLLWPVVYLFLTSLMQQTNSFKWLAKVLIAALWAVTIYGYIYLGWEAGFIPDYLYYELDQGQNAGFYDGFVEYNLYSISSLIFLIPFYLHYLIEKHKNKENILKLQDIFLVLAASILAVMTGRRALLLILMMLPLIIFISNKLLFNTYKLKFSSSTGTLLFFLAMGFLGFMIVFELRFDAIYDMVLEGFNFSDQSNLNAFERTLQFHSLIDGWLDTSILFGAGNGASASVIRSYEFSWAYELTYVYLLFSTGIAGVMIYFGWFGYGLLRLRQAMREREDLVVYAAPMLTASISFCIASSTNPYFGKFDYLWIVWLPFLIAGWAQYQNKVDRK